MYSVYADGTCIYDDTSTDKKLRLVNPVLELADNSVGKFKMTIPVTSAGYDLVERLTTNISVRRNDEELWAGRVLDESIDFWKNRTLTCEGELAVLNDTIQPLHLYERQTVKQFLQAIIAIHNEKASINNRYNKKFTVGRVTVEDSDLTVRCTDYRTTMEEIKANLTDQFGGHLVVRKERGVRYLDYLADISTPSTQTIEFGVNLLDYAASYDITDFATVVYPLGASLGPKYQSRISGIEDYATITFSPNLPYVQNPYAVKTFGWIEKTVHFDKLVNDRDLIDAAESYLTDHQFASLALEIKAFDLHYLNPEIKGLNIGDQIRVISHPHGVNRDFMLTKLSIPLDKPENAQFTLGSTEQMTLTSMSSAKNSALEKKIADTTNTSKVYLDNNVYLWYDSTDEHLKLNVNGTDTIVS